MRLAIRTGSPEGQEITLDPGTYRFGRNPDNDFVIIDPSVSSFHAQIEVEDCSATIKDLGSTNGTFAKGVKVEEISLLPGESFQLGSVDIQLLTSESFEPALQASPALSHAASSGASVSVSGDTLAISRPIEEPAESDKPIFCKNHYQNPGLYHCAKCKKFFCDLCVNTRGSSFGGLRFCKVCGEECRRVSIQAHVPKTINFFQEVPSAFKYPFAGDGPFILFGGTFFFGFLDAANYISRHAFAYGMRAMTMRAVIFTFILGIGYLFSFLKNVIHASAHGDKQMPDWPELSEWYADIVSPMFQFCMICLASFGPAALFSIWADGDYPWLVDALSLLGCAYLPMAFLGVAMFDSLVALNPKFIFGSILRVPREYGVAALVFILILTIRWAISTLFERLLHIPLVPTLVGDLLTIALLIVEARILGLLYASQKSVLGWFKTYS